MTPAQSAHFFRHEYGRLVSLLARRVGFAHLEAVEDAVQFALLKAVETWPRLGEPDPATPWLYRVACNHLISERRLSALREGLIGRLGPSHESTLDPGEKAALSGDLRDDLLRMLFACCDEAIPIESRLVFALKTLCGFDVREIAQRLFTTSANVYKRLGRAREVLRNIPLALDPLGPIHLSARLPVVQVVLYLMFTEGYLSSRAHQAIRLELCDEAIRLTHLLAEHSLGATPETFALLALMHLHRARTNGRTDASGGLLLLEEQDRSRWDAQEIAEGMTWLARSAQGSVFSRYHAEAGIVAEHCLAASMEQTRWEHIVSCYELLDRTTPSALHTLNRAIAVAEWRGPEQGLAVLEGLEPPSWLDGSYLWSAVLADLHRRCGHLELAFRYRESALAAAPSETIRAALRRRLK